MVVYGGIWAVIKKIACLEGFGANWNSVDMGVGVDFEREEFGATVIGTRRNL